MKTAELRDQMVARVKETFAKWRSFDDMPDATELAYDVRIEFKGDLSAQPNYVEALHSICAVATPVGRLGENQMVGFSSRDAMEAGQRAGREVAMKIDPAIDG